MNIVDRQAIEDLFRRLKDAEKDGGPRDPEAEELISRLVSRQPAAAYYLAQTVLVQQWALNAAHDKIEALERRGAGGGLFSALFGGRPSTAGSSARSAVPPSLGQTAATGFLATASNTALGVAGGFILADMLAQGNFSDQALASSFDPPEAAAPVDAGGALGGFGGGDFGGGDFGGGDAGGF
jgi:hypothetical protein